jgi:hypothetical protein
MQVRPSTGSSVGVTFPGGADGTVSARRLPGHWPSYPVANAAFNAPDDALNDFLAPRPRLV